MSQVIVAGVRAKFPTPLGAQHGAFLLEVAAVLRLGLLRKSGGSFIVLPDGTKVSQDCAMERNGVHYDILFDGEDKAEPRFDRVNNPDGTPLITDPNNYYDVTALAPVQPVPSQPPAPASPDLFAAFSADVRASLGRVETLLRELQNRPDPAPAPAPSVTFPKYQGSTDITLPFIGKQHVTMTLEPKP